MQNLADKLKNELKQIERKEPQGTKIRAKINWELQGEKCTIFFPKTRKKKECRSGYTSLKSRQNDKILKNQQEILTGVKTFYEQLYGQKTMSRSGLKSIIALR